jgi:hypothetical protein
MIALVNPTVLRQASEAERLLSRMEALALQAIAALQADDTGTLLATLDERERCRLEAEPLLEAVHLTREDRRAAGAMEPLVAALLASAESLRSADERLKLALAAQRDQLARELDRLDDDAAVRSAYGQAPPRTRSLNIVR